MKISNTQFIQQFTFCTKTNKTQEEIDKLSKIRKDNPELDRTLYQSDLAKFYEELSKAEQLAIKVAKGENLSKEEEEFLKSKNPDLFKKAIMAKQEGANLKSRLKNAKNKREVQNILAQSSSTVVGLQKIDPVYANMLMEAFKTAYSEYKNNKNYNPPYTNTKKYFSLMLDRHC